MTASSDQLPSDLADAHAMIVALRSEALIRRLETEKLKFLIAKLRREQFGQSSERGRLLVEQLELAIADVEESQGAAEAEADIAAPGAPLAERQSRPARSRRPSLPEHLPVERIVYPAPCACAQCGGSRLRKLDDVVSRSLECEPRRWMIVEHVREKMTCRDCEGVTETPAPSHPIPRGFAGPNLLASVLVSKFMLHQPLNRQSDTFAREGIAIDTSTLADRVGACAVALAPIVDAIRRHVLAADRIHGDDTTVPVLAKGKTDTGRLWTYVRDDRPFGGTGPPAAAFHYSRSRSGEHPREHLATYGGILQADAYAGYNDLYDGRRRPTPVIEAACWAHGRRKLFDIAKLTKAPIAVEAVRRIDEIFAVERTINGRSAAERVAARQQHSKPLILDLEMYLREQRIRLSAKSDTAKATTYILSRWVAFTRFLDDGRICMSTDGVEKPQPSSGRRFFGRVANSGVDVLLVTSADFGASRSEAPMILSAIAAKLKHRSKDDFKGRHFEAGLIVQAVSWYLRYPLSYRDIEELLLERGFEVDHSTVNRWVLAYAPLIERRLRPFRKPHCGSIRVDETYVRIRGEWRYLYRAIDKHGEAVDFLLTARRDLDAAKRFFRKALKDGPLLSPDRIGTDGAGIYPPALAAARKEGLLSRDPVHHVTKHLQQGIESDHFRVKKNMPKVGGFQSFNTARRSIQGFEAMLWLRKGFGFAGAWTVIEQNRLLGFCFGLSKVNEA